MPYSAKATANNRWEVIDESRQDRLMALAYGWRNAEHIVRALTLMDGEQLELFEQAAQPMGYGRAA